MPPNPRIGIVGLGGIGTLHAETVESLGGRIVGGVDLDPDARAAFEERFDAPTYENQQAILDDSCLDGLVVTTPNRYHRDVAVAALDADVPVLVEKPLAESLASARDIARAARRSDAFCMTGFHNRYSGPMQVLRSHIQDGQLGTVTHVEANYVRRRGIPGRGSWFTEAAVAGGGALIDVGVHVLDLALNVLDYDGGFTTLGTTRTEFGEKGVEYAYLHMWGDDDPAGTFDVEDSASAFIRADNGASIALEVAWATNRPETHTIYVRGTDGGAAVDIEAGTLTRFATEKHPTDHHRDIEVAVGETNPYEVEQKDFLDAIAADGHPSQNTVEEALLVQHVVDGIYRSSASGNAVRIDPARPVQEGRT